MSKIAAKAGRLEREKDTVLAMIGIYCSGHHPGPPLCAQCEELYAYAHKRIDQCPFQECKPTCARCHVHCYKPTRREEIRRVMRYAGPRMLFSHPLLSLRHYLDEWRGLNSLTAEAGHRSDRRPIRKSRDL